MRNDGGRWGGEGWARVQGFLRAILLGLVFVALPWGFFEAAFLIFGETRLARSREEARIAHEKVLARLLLVDDDAVFATRLVRVVFRRLQKRGARRGLADLAALQRHFPGAFELYFFDGAGRLIPELSSEKRSKRFLERAYQVIGAIDRGEKTPSEQIAVLRQLWNMSRVESLKGYVRGRPMPIGEDPSAGYCCFEYAREPQSKTVSGYIGFYDPRRTVAGFAARYAVRAASRRYPGMQFAVVDLKAKPALFFPAAVGERPEVRAAYLKAQAAYNPEFVDEDLLLTVAQRRQSGHLLAVRDIPEPIPAFLIWILRLGLLGWGIRLMIALAGGGNLADSRISGRIIRLFLFSVGVPAGVLLLGGFRALEDHALVQQNALERAMRAKIGQFDERFPQEILRIEQSLKQLQRQALKRAGKIDEYKVFEKVRDEKSITDFLVIDANGKSVWQLREPENSSVAQRFQIGRLMGREILKRLNRVDRVDMGTLVNESVSSFMGNFAEAGSWELFQRNLGGFTPFGLANEGCFMLFDALFDSDGVARRMVCAVMFRDQAEARYFRRTRRAFERQPDFTWRVSLFSRARISRPIYSKKRHKKMVDEIGKAVDSQLASVRKIVETPRGRELWIGQLGRHMKGYVFVAQTSLQPLENRVRRLWALGAALVALLVLATMVIGLLLSEQLLQPIRHISSGIQAIRDRDFQVRIPVQARDELGEVSGLMNDVLEGMKDLSVARAIQENLFPQEEMRVRGLSVYGKSRTMTDVGGDYFEYVKLDDRRLFGVIGDVSGHGVSAALIMGMAKCFFSLQNLVDAPLGDALLGFNQYLFQTIKRLKMMTMVVFRWDADTNTIQFSNAGHVSPFIRRHATGLVEELKMPCRPLGITKNAQFQTHELTLAPGDTVFLCTDGFPETKNPRDQQIGYVQPFEWFGRLGSRSPKEIVSALFIQLDEFRAGAPVADDITMICLKVEAPADPPPAT